MDPVSLPTLDAHGHLDSFKPESELDAAGAVLAMTLSPDEFEASLKQREAGRTYPFIAWGAGCHPGAAGAQEAFDPVRFRRLAEKAAVLGEIGLDGGSRAPLETQLATFRAILAIASELGRPVSIHSRHAVALVLDELERAKPPVAVLHWWLGSAGQTSRAVDLGCYFSIHTAVARYSKFRTRVPIGRVLVETDHGYNDPPAGIPPRLEWAELLVARQYGLDAVALRRQIWRNFRAIVERTGVAGLLPEGIAGALAGISE